MPDFIHTRGLTRATGVYIGSSTAVTVRPTIGDVAIVLPQSPANSTVITINNESPTGTSCKVFAADAGCVLDRRRITPLEHSGS